MIQIVYKLADKIHSTEFVAEHRRTEQDFTRHRTLTFPRLISFMLNNLNGSIQNELSRFFRVVDDSPIALTSVSTAAFCKARKKISYTAFKALNADLIETFYRSNQVKRWRGFRLLAVDGSVTQLPVSSGLMKYFGKARSQAHMPAVRLSQLYDINNRLTLDLQVDSHTVGERNMALKHLAYANQNDLILYDRGYPAVWFFKMHQRRNIHFCARTTVASSNFAKEFVESGQLDAVVELPCIEKSLRRCRKEGLSTEAITIRLVRVELPTGDIEVLMTSLLDEDVYPHSLFSDLYHQRWGIEEDYKVMKSRLNLENFSGLSVDAVMQDIHAKTLTKNIVALATINAEPLKTHHCDQRKHAYKINFTYALSQIKDTIVRFLLRIAPLNLSQLLAEKIAIALNAYRPGRRHKRPSDKRNRVNKYPIAYKRVC